MKVGLRTLGRLLVISGVLAVFFQGRGVSSAAASITSTKSEASPAPSSKSVKYWSPSRAPYSEEVEDHRYEQPSASNWTGNGHGHSSRDYLESSDFRTERDTLANQRAYEAALINQAALASHRRRNKAAKSLMDHRDDPRGRESFEYAPPSYNYIPMNPDNHYIYSDPYGDAIKRSTVARGEPVYYTPAKRDLMYAGSSYHDMHSHGSHSQPQYYHGGHGGSGIGLIALLANLLLWFYASTIQPTPGPPGPPGPTAPGPPGPTGPTGRRRKRDVSINPLANDIFPQPIFELTVNNTPKARADRLVKKVIPHLNIVSHVRAGNIPINCTHREICLANRLLVKELGEFGRPVGYILSLGVAQLIGEIEKSKATREHISEAAKKGRDGGKCEELFSTCKGVEALEPILYSLDQLDSYDMERAKAKIDFNLLLKQQ